MVDLTSQIGPIELAHPIMPGAGPPVQDRRSGLLALQGGASALVTKTISSKAAQVPCPFMVKEGVGLLNCELSSHLSPSQWIQEIPSLTGQLPLIISIGYQKEDMEYLIPLFRPYATAFEISTHYLMGDVLPMMETIGKARELTSLPLFVKLSPGRDIPLLVKSAQEAGADALVLINSLGPSFDFQISPVRPLLGSRDGYGWLSGPALFPLALGSLLQAASLTSLPLIGVGGIRRGEEVVKMIMAGASGVQVCTGAILEGPSIYERLKIETQEIVKELGYSSLQEMKGTIGKKLPQEVSLGLSPPQVNEQVCTCCQKCLTSCPTGAIVIKGKKAFIREGCQSCGLCVSLCPLEAILWEGRP